MWRSEARAGEERAVAQGVRSTSTAVTRSSGNGDTAPG